MPCVPPPPPILLPTNTEMGSVGFMLPGRKIFDAMKDVFNAQRSEMKIVCKQRGANKGDLSKSDTGTNTAVAYSRRFNRKPDAALEWSLGELIANEQRARRAVVRRPAR